MFCFQHGLTYSQNYLLSCNPHFLPVKYFLGFDLGSSSVKAALLDAGSGKPLASAFSPASEMKINAPKPGFAEQDPENWWQELIQATRPLQKKIPFASDEIGAIGIAYQMHGLVCIDKNNLPLRPAIIWCDSRAVDYGAKAFETLGQGYCLEHFLNSPGNFTASKLKWVKENEPEIYKKTVRVLLPGDFIALKLTGEAATTISGLSEGIFWDYKEDNIAGRCWIIMALIQICLHPAFRLLGCRGNCNPLPRRYWESQRAHRFVIGQGISQTMHFHYRF